VDRPEVGMAFNFPYDLQNGQIADADQVMANFNALAGAQGTTSVVFADQYGVESGIDCTTALRDAVAAASAYSTALLILPPGFLLLSDTITLTKGIYMAGAGIPGASGAADLLDGEIQ